MTTPPWNLAPVAAALNAHKAALSAHTDVIILRVVFQRPIPKGEQLYQRSVDWTGLGETVERPDARREVVQTGEVFEVAAIAA